ncbi:hypothetical protein C2L64_47880 [Paraburkholderia hospita]|jgi:uncharacterized protein (UPF0276 family)|uniref:Uncharacterized protein n=1 Tax=Paraburkholderia hospita TaxID=169430 RepID=A0AAN1JMC7_9BURK|nr:DUF692 domain-containing protein [Paraburkholderia hospita]AUT75963.1 hypothetical protein C2L64_47880 [Paraburkholderia hospita]
MATGHSLLESTPVRASSAIRPIGDLGVGIGLRHDHYPDFLAGKQSVDWLEVHTENYMGDGGYDLHVLERVRRDYPLSFHGVGLSLGSAGPLDPEHLNRVASLVNRFQPALVSEHLCWSTVLTRHLHDLLPLPFTLESLDVVTRHVAQMQDVLKRNILIENVSSHVRFREDEMTESDFLRELVRRTGCAILLDINDLYVNQCNHGENAFDALGRIPPSAVEEIHLGGHFSTEHFVVNHHGARISTDVWQLYGYAVELFGSVPTLIEWDTDVPPIRVLLDEASTAKRVAEAFDRGGRDGQNS